MLGLALDLEYAPSFRRSAPAVPVNPPAYASHTVATNSLAATYPAGIVAGNLLLGVALGNGTDDLAYTAPAGFTLIGSIRWGLTTGVACPLYVFGKIADGTETGACTFVRSAGAANAEGAFVARYTNCSGWEGMRTFSTENDLTTPMVSPAVTTTVPNCLLVNIFGQQQNQVLNPAAGWTERWDQGANNAGASDYICANHEKAVAGIGPQAPEVPTYVTGFRRGVVSFALKPV